MFMCCVKRKRYTLIKINDERKKNTQNIEEEETNSSRKLYFFNKACTFTPRGATSQRFIFCNHFLLYIYALIQRLSNCISLLYYNKYQTFYFYLISCNDCFFDRACQDINNVLLYLGMWNIVAFYIVYFNVFVNISIDIYKSSFNKKNQRTKHISNEIQHINL